MQDISPNSNKLSELMEKYFVPPITTQYMNWGQTIMVLFLFLTMFLSIAYWYIYSNYSDYQNRISVITNAYLFGKDPQSEFEQYIKNAQASNISTAVNTIQSNTDDMINESSRLNHGTTRLAAQVSTELPKNQAETSNLGISILDNIAKLRASISKIGGAFMLNNYITDGAISTTQVRTSPVPSSYKAPSTAPAPSSYKAPSTAPVPSSYKAPSTAPAPSSYKAPSTAPVPSSYKAPSTAPVPSSYKAPSTAPVPSSYKALSPSLSPK